MTEVNKEELRRKAKDAISPNGFEPLVIFRECATPAAILSLLDDLDQAKGMCAKHSKALQEIGSALSLGAGADLHRDCAPAVYRLFQSIGSGVSEAYKERMACQRVIDQLRAENESLRAQLKACHPFRPAQELKR